MFRPSVFFPSRRAFAPHAGRFYSLPSVSFSLFSAFADEGLELYPTRIDRDKLRTVTGIEQLVAAAQANAGRMRV